MLLPYATSVVPLEDWCRWMCCVQVLEVGAGYTSIYIVQALADNAAEMANYGKLQRAGKAKCGEVPWLVEDALPRQLEGTPLLHTVDSMAHASTTAHKVPLEKILLARHRVIA